MKTYLHIKFGQKARDNDIRKGLTVLDEKGTDARQIGPKKAYGRQIRYSWTRLAMVY